jgi:S1-C subfamily serine protease
MHDRFLTRLFWITFAGALLILLARYLPLLESAFAPDGAPPRAITARGDLAADEKSTIELFEKSKDSVVFITTHQQVMDFWTRNVFSVPRGTGSGFIWDEAGHVITNFHVVQGASEAWVKLSDGRDYRATLVGASPQHDIAVLRIGVGFKRPPPVPVGTSSDLKVGQKVFRAPDTNRCSNQSRQFRRTAAGFRRAINRHQYGNLQPERRLGRYWFCGAGGYGDACRAAAYK